MRELLQKESVTLTELWTFYDPDHHQRELAISFAPTQYILFSKREKEVTVKKLGGIAQVLYGDSTKFKDALKMPSFTNLLDQPLTCSLIFVDDELVAIADENNRSYCHLLTGHVLDEETLSKIYQSKKQKSLSIEINHLRRRLEQKIAEYEELEKMTF